MNYSSLGKKPISKKNHTGSDVTYEKVFIELQNEIEKLSNADRIESFSWVTVVQLASEILKNLSKDIRVAAFLCTALIYTEKKGFDSAVTIMNDLLNTYWKDLFPPIKRTRGRTEAIKWWAEKTTDVIKQKGIDSVSANTKKKLNNIEKFLEQTIQEDSRPTIEPLLLALKNNKKNKAETKQIQSNSKLTTLGIDPVEIHSGRSQEQNIKLVFTSLKQLAKLGNKKSPSDPMPYRWVRIAAWEPIKKIPPAEKNRKTKISPPPAISSLADLKNSEDWEKLLEAAETKMYVVSYTFKLDINFYVATALKNLGKKFSKAHKAVCTETFYLLNRMPGVENLLFSDKTPFAEAETKKWLSGLSKVTTAK